VSQTKETKEFADAFPDFREEEKTQALEAAVEAIVSRVLLNVQGCDRPNCEPALEEYIYKDATHPDIKGKPQYVGQSATKLMQDDIADEIISVIKRFHEIDGE